MTGFVRIDRPGEATVVLTIDRAERRNALSIAVRDEISDALDELAADESVRVLVITGAGSTFCAGFDLGEFEVAAADGEFATRLWASSDRYHRTLASFPLPTVAAVNGPAVAGGFDLAVLCDLRVVSSTARFSHPERTFGEVVYGPLRELVGGAVARDLTLTGRTLDAEEALVLGVATRVAPPDEVYGTALALAARIAEAPRAQLVGHKAKILRQSGRDPSTGTLDL
ncbi:MAG: enoyl-CoA hydratase/isomerase family protein [Acidimicrobiales bacterium]|jgi:enoyl-CoA hydratase|nr:enoyl-CoA hydratase/isomerase family protein [Acidimicrobiales bacterium]